MLQGSPFEPEMHPFRHVVVPLGVVIGMGVAHIVTTLAKYIRNRENVRFCFAHSAWAAISLVWFVGLWWMLWQYRQVEADRWSFFPLILLLVGPAVLYLAVTLLLPSTQNGEVLDLGERFDQVGRPFFSCLGSVIIWLGTAEIVLLGQDVFEPHRFAQLAAAILLGVGAAIPSRRTANVLGVLFLIAASVAFATFRAGLG